MRATNRQPGHCPEDSQNTFVFKAVPEKETRKGEGRRREEREEGAVADCIVCDCGRRWSGGGCGWLLCGCVCGWPAVIVLSGVFWPVDWLCGVGWP